jgi:3-oxoacyl-[acyl-carrier-protein] synthase III
MKSVSIGAPVYLRSIGYALGELRPLAEVPELAKDESALETFLALGLEKFSRSDRTPPEMAHEAMQKTLAAANVSPDSIDVLIYASDTPPMRTYYGEDIRELSCSLGLSNAYPIGLFLSECGNCHLALRQAADLIRLGRADRVLVVTSDRCVENYPRVWTSVTVLSDGACSFLVERERPAEGFELCSTAHRTNPGLWKLDLSTQLLEYFKGVVENVGLVSRDALTAEKLAPGDVKRVIVNNYSYSVIRTFVRQAGFKMSQAYVRNLARFAHTFASDAFINLSDMTSECEVTSGDYVLMVGSATTTWGASLVRKI